MTTADAHAGLLHTEQRARERAASGRRLVRERLCEALGPDFTRNLEILSVGENAFRQHVATVRYMGGRRVVVTVDPIRRGCTFRPAWGLCSMDATRAVLRLVKPGKGRRTVRREPASGVQAAGGVRRSPQAGQ